MRLRPPLLVVVGPGPHESGRIGEGDGKDWSARPRGDPSSTGSPNFDKPATLVAYASHYAADVAACHDVYPLLPCAPDLNPVEGIWSALRRTITVNHAFADPHDLIIAVRRGLRRLQYRHDVLDGCLTSTGPPLKALR
ncbi:hypothetical protein ACGF3G_39800 [Streptomyces sp. NPDC048179]|uniref:hypothetical protein n=1 Tax=Streptomyces sp. NPDC048179 TaxID=3365506 RepID=UPI0037189DD6